MKRKWKIIITVAAVLIAVIGVYASTVYSKRGVVAVQTGKVVRGDLTSLVTASGEIKPKNYINIGANAMGEITNSWSTRATASGRASYWPESRTPSRPPTLTRRKPAWPPPRPMPTPPKPA